VPIDSNAFDIEELSDWIEDPKFNQLKKVVVGALVMILDNINIEKGVNNGAMGKVEAIHFKEDTNVEGITIGMLESGYKTKLKKGKTKFNYTYTGKYFKSTFLLALAYAMTGHKAQGATVAAKVIIDIREAFTPGLTYVLLSRVTESKYVMLPRKLIVDDFNPVKRKILNNKE
jgi:ATP-dependent exoDNAse (exonuclease V) alpha subunit